MPFNASGVFTRLYRWVTDRDNDIKIDATRMDAEMDGIVAGLNAVVNQTRAFTGNVKAPAGTALTPAFSFSNDPDTGVFRAGAGCGRDFCRRPEPRDVQRGGRDHCGGGAVGT